MASGTRVGGAALGIGLISAVLSGLGLLVILAVGRHYGADPAVYLRQVLPLGGGLVMALLLMLRRARSGLLSMRLSLVGAVIGLGLAGYGVVMSARDPGDAPFLYVWPLLAGLSLVVLAFEERQR